MFENIIKGRFFAKAIAPDSDILKLSNDDYLKRLAEGKDIYLARARIWSGYDKWAMHEAASLLSGLVPTGDDSAKFFFQLCWSETEKDESTTPCKYVIFRIFPRNEECLKHVTEILKRSDIGDQASPKKWAEYAQTKGLLPHTEPFADIDNSPLLSLLEARNAPGSVLFRDGASDAPSISDPSYSTAWLDILTRAIAQFFNPRRDLDPKREEVVEWIISEAAKAGLPQSKNIAVAIFTIIKPDDHDPKKKRVEPS
ncbi:hypothetical protein SAMN05216299_1333 [Nitrosospira sp. Nsp14]|uniref:hypothetical protein n=1 Tax=Nitrosospira sp. Nsp14 TaxID=1855333 RepID=UPI0008F2E4E7|nr:hypothetical protein [Nitrosospira sp. Nsp14]SFH60632.1 hypothetical protein SAMN05216299_1333 [Nitrosospira sp. Nsp14]